MIEYLVISSGGYEIFKQISAVNHFFKTNFLKYQDLKVLYGVSSGSIISLLISLHLDFNVIEEYFIERPWEKLFVVDTSAIFSAYDKCGIFTIEIFYNFLKPLLKLAGLDCDVTFKQLYEKNGKLLKIIASNCSSLEKKIFSYIETPDAKVVDVVYMSSSLPFLFKPHKYENDFYIDGGFHGRFPMDQLLNDYPEIDNDRIFGIETYFTKKDTIINMKNMSTYILSMLNRIVEKYVYKESIYPDIKFLRIKSHIEFSLEQAYALINDKKYRKKLTKEGETDAIIYLKYINYEIPL